MRLAGRTNSHMKVFAPLKADSPLVTDDKNYCLACGGDFNIGEFTTLVPLGPGTDPEEVLKAQNGHKYNSVCIPVHASCAGMIPGEER